VTFCVPAEQAAAPLGTAGAVTPLPDPQAPLTGGALGAEQDAVEPPPLPAQFQLKVPSLPEPSVTLCAPTEHAALPLGTLPVATPLPEPQAPLATATLGAEQEASLPPYWPVQFQLKVPSAPAPSLTA
jgi:hypothetical protein